MPATSLLDLKSLTAEHVASVFSLADKLSIEKPADRDRIFRNRQGLTAALVFFEPSTRTRMSFEMACGREGVSAVLFDGGSGTSLEKGETPEDTVLNVAAMQPSFLVIRCGDSLDLMAISRKIKTPILNAGWGRLGHPTQALLDAYSIQKQRGPLSAQKVLLIGDVRHSRVASSHLDLARVLGYEVAFCGPVEYLLQETTTKKFNDLKEGLQWATVAMALRVQKERHDGNDKVSDYSAKWGLNASSIASLSPHGLIMHPGPVNWGVEISPELATDRRCIILDQVRNGVMIRQALIRQLLEAV